MTGVASKLRRGSVEFLAIFLGVSLSLLADDWRQDRGERQESERVAELLASDLAQDLERLETQIRVDSSGATAGAWLHANWGRPDLPIDSLTWAWQTLHGGMPFTPVRSEYESAKSAGRLQYIQDDDLRAEVAGYYELGQPHLQAVNQIALDATIDMQRALRPYYSFDTVFEGRIAFPTIEAARMWPDVWQENSVRSAVVQATAFRHMITRQLQSHRERTIQLASRLRRDTFRIAER